MHLNLICLKLAVSCQVKISMVEYFLANYKKKSVRFVGLSNVHVAIPKHLITDSMPVEKDNPALSGFLDGFGQDLAPIMGEIAVLELEKHGPVKLPHLTVTNLQPELFVKTVALKQLSNTENEYFCQKEY